MLASKRGAPQWGPISGEGKFPWRSRHSFRLIRPPAILRSDPSPPTNVRYVPRYVGDQRRLDSPDCGVLMVSQAARAAIVDC
jgi:hypothetical protein